MTLTVEARPAASGTSLPRQVPSPHRTTGQGGQRRFRADIEGLRAIAVLMVVLFHAGVPYLTGGYIGVDIFFVISGFLITSNLYRELEQTGRISLIRFYSRRMTRLLPASVVVLACTLLASWHWMSPLRWKGISFDTLASAAYAMNYRLAVQGTDYLAAATTPSPLQHFWSLAVEEQFYLVWPVLLAVASLAWLRGRRPRPAVAAAVLGVISVGSFAVCVWQTRHSLPWAYFGIQSRAWELGAGALTALAARPLCRLRPAVAAVLTWLGVAVLIGTPFWFTEQTFFPGYTALLPVAGTVAVIAGGCAAPRRGAGLVLDRQPFQIIGGLSYGWYLWHWPLLMIAPAVAGRTLGVWANLGLVAGALLLAVMSLSSLENPVRFYWVFRLRPLRGLSTGLGLTATAVAAAVAASLIPVRIPAPAATVARPAMPGHVSDPAQLAALIDTSAAAAGMPANLRPELTSAFRDFPKVNRACLAETATTDLAAALAARCDRLGDGDSTTTVVLLGDSHAHQWYPALLSVASERHWRLAVFTKGGCTPASATTLGWETKRPYLECDTWRENALRQIRGMHPALVVMSGLGVGGAPIGKAGDSEIAWARAWETTVEPLHQQGIKVAMIADTPYPGKDVPGCVAQHPGDLQACNLPITAVANPRRRRLVADAVTAAGGTVIDPAPWFCNAETCPVVIGDVLVYRDASHITDTYAGQLDGLLKEKLP